MAHAPSSHSLVFARNMPTSDQSLDDFRLHLETASSSCSERACPSHSNQIVFQVCLSRKQHPSCVLSLPDPQTPPHLCSESVCPTDSTQRVFRGYLSHKHHPTCVRSACPTNIILLVFGLPVPQTSSYLCSVCLSHKLNAPILRS